MAHLTRARPATWPARYQLLLAVVGLELFVLVGYFLATPATVTTPRYVLYPFVWINAVLYAVARIPVRRAPGRQKLLAGAAASGYFLLLANWAGLVGLTVTGHHPIPEGILGLQIGAGSPGWERVRFITRVFYVQFVPFRVIGYLGLAYLVYAAVLDATGAVASGAIGLLSCLSCSFPIVASLLTGVWGGSVTLMSTVYAHSVDISTAAFLVSVALLYWRPGFPSVRAAGEESDEESGGEN